jgi:NRAMP (natural resistance-associated macrophage protein)-like metal ion transporter
VTGNKARPSRRFPRIRRIWNALGPGVVTGAADDDPAGIATYSIAGAQLGTGLLWTALVTWPMMASVEAMCARIGMVTGSGLATALRSKFPRIVLAVACAALFIANTINIGADLSGMADALELLTNVSSHIWVVIAGLLIGWATVRLRYVSIASILRWLALVLFVYVFTAAYLHPDWRAVGRATVIPSLPHGREAWAVLVAILGTTISPYLFFWQASQEVEEEKSHGRKTVEERRGASIQEIQDRKIDVAVGTFFSNAVMFFIILTTALTLHAHGITSPQTSREVAEALEPLAGRFASLLYTIGLIGTGTLAIPTLAGSAAYALAETFGWNEGMDERYDKARAFYAVVIVSIGGGVALDFANLNAVRTLFLSSVLNGLLAPFLLLGILLVATDRKLMAGQPSSPLGEITVGVTTVAMFAAAMAMLIL